MADFLAGYVDMFKGIGQALIAYWPYIKIMLIFVCIAIFVMIRSYIQEGLQCIIYNRMQGMGKHKIKCNDGKIREYWCNLNEDCILREVKGTNTARAFMNNHKRISIDRHGIRCLYFTQDFSGPCNFVPYKKYVYADKKTGELLKDKNGNYVNHLSIVDLIKNRYAEQIMPEIKNYTEFVQPKLIDNVVPKINESSKGKELIVGPLYPNEIMDNEDGMDNMLLADLIVRKTKIDTMAFINKYWDYIRIGGIIIGACSVITLILVWNQGSNFTKIMQVLAQIKDYVSGAIPPLTKV